MDVLQQVDVSLIQPNPEQPRKTFDQAKLEQLAESIKTHGLIHPITVEQNGTGFVLIAGERRWRAHQLAGLPTIQAKVIQPGNEETRRRRSQAAFVENYQREQLNPVEEGQAIRQMRDDLGMTLEEIGQALGMSKSTVSNKIRLVNDLPDAILDHVAAGKLSERQAAALLPFFSLPESMREKMEKPFGLLLEDILATGKSSELIRKDLDWSIKRNASQLDRCIFFSQVVGEGHDMVFSGGVIQVSTCEHCPVRIGMDCPDLQCFARKTELTYQAAAEKLKRRHNLPLLPLGSHFYDYKTFYYLSNADIKLALDNRCENMAGFFDPWEYSDHMQLFPGVKLVCTKKNCRCENRIMRLRNGEPEESEKPIGTPLQAYPVLKIHFDKHGLNLERDREKIYLSASDVWTVVEGFCAQNGIDPAVLRAKPTPATPPTPPDEPKTLTELVQEHAEKYTDEKGRTWQDIPNPSHTNGQYWQDVRQYLLNMGHQWPDDAKLKLAIKQAFSLLKQST